MQNYVIKKLISYLQGLHPFFVKFYSKYVNFGDFVWENKI